MSKPAMFRKMSKLNPLTLGKERFDTLIGPSSRIEGNFFLTESIRVDGTIKGNLKEGEGVSVSVVVGGTGLVYGDIVAQRVVVAGKVHGNILASERIELRAGCTVTGDIRYQSMAVEHGANLHGKLLQMGHGDAAGCAPGAPLQADPSAN